MAIKFNKIKQQIMLQMIIHKIILIRKTKMKLVNKIQIQKIVILIFQFI